MPKHKHPRIKYQTVTYTVQYTLILSELFMEFKFNYF